MFLYMGEALTWLTQSVPTFAQASGSIRHLDDFLLQESEPADPLFATALGRLEMAIEFRDVSFAYPDGRFRIDNFSLTIPRGCKCAIVGNSGSGKSTILALLLRLIEPEGGATCSMARTCAVSRAPRCERSARSCSRIRSYSTRRSPKISAWAWKAQREMKSRRRRATPRYTILL
jgi:ABC-type transport system involved in cytochrome bd biosynthesis fused ATPase/permease subunit